MHRIAVLEHVVKLKMEENADDLHNWTWLQDVVQHLGEHGMSSEESDIENDVEQVLWVKTMGWRHSIERELDLIDLQWLLDDDIFSPQGSQPMRRIRSQAKPSSSQPAVKGLPISFYDSAWFSRLTQRQTEALELSTSKTFSWRRVAAAR